MKHSQCNYPRLPISVLFADSCKGISGQVWKIDGGGHRLFEELRFIKKAADFREGIELEYEQRGNYCPLKMQAFINERMLSTFGMIPYPC